MSIWKVKSGLEIEVFLFRQDCARNIRTSSYFGIHKEEDGCKRILEWDLAGRCVYASIWFHFGINPMAFLWDNTGPMFIDRFADLESYDLLLVAKSEVNSEKIPSRKIINPIFCLELE